MFVVIVVVVVVLLTRDDAKVKSIETILASNLFQSDSILRGLITRFCAECICVILVLVRTERVLLEWQ